MEPDDSTKTRLFPRKKAPAEPLITFGTPRKLPNPKSLEGRVIVLDIAFAGVSGGGFEKVTKKFIDGLGPRLALWVDHHDHDRHRDFANDSRFLLRKKSEHGACPEMIGEALVLQTGPIDTIVCHNDFDGLVSAAKWLRGGLEPYPGADADARAIDTRLGDPSPLAVRVDRALRARPQDEAFHQLVVHHLAEGAHHPLRWERIDEAAAELVPIERETERAAKDYRIFPCRPGLAERTGIAERSGIARRSEITAAYVAVDKGYGRLDKTQLLLLGQKRATLAIVVDNMNVSIAAPFDSGLDFLVILGLEGGMPTRVSLARNQLNLVIDRLGIDFIP